jgi:uncharacterized PurR-regulated membrane protein YhhQ (DUF165 family)
MFSISFLRKAALPLAAFSLVVLAANILVQYPMHILGLQETFTYGAFCYPLVFLVNDTTNRRYGAPFTRRVVLIGFFIAVLLSAVFATPRIALASGTAFLAANLLDVQIFDRLRRLIWWLPPLGSAVISSALDTALFFSIAFAGIAKMSFGVELFGYAVPLWVKLGVFDYFVKLVMAGLMVIPYGALMPFTRPVLRENTI